VRCPKCEYEQPDGALECARCGIIFARWRDPWGHQAPAWAPPTAQSTAPATSSGPRSILKIAGFLGAAAGWLWFFFWAPGGLPVPSESYQDAEHGFALTVPEDWQAVKANQCRTATSGLDEATYCMVLEVRRAGDENRPGPTVQLTVAPIGALVKTGLGGSVRLTERDKAALVQAVEKGFAGTIPGYTTDSSEILAVDRIPSLQVRGSATIQGTPVTVAGKAMSVPSMFGKTPEYHVTVNLVMVPSGSRAYFLVGGTQAQDDPVLSPALNQIVQSFRVTSGRATPFQQFGGLMGSIPGDAILGFLVAITLALFRI
jgi:hypothetical protein